MLYLLFPPSSRLSDLLEFGILAHFCISFIYQSKKEKRPYEILIDSENLKESLLCVNSVGDHSEICCGFKTLECFDSQRNK